MHLNNAYVRRGELDVQQLFTIVNLTRQAQETQESILASLTDMQEMLLQNTVPQIEVGPHCAKPFTCDFYGFCHQNNETDIFTGVKNIKKGKIDQLREAGVNSMDAIPDRLHFTAKEWVILKGVLNDEIRINKPALNDFVSKLHYPIYFIDFETMQPSIPLYNRITALSADSFSIFTAHP